MTRRPRNIVIASLLVITTAVWTGTAAHRPVSALSAPLIVNGIQATITQRPYQAAILNTGYGSTRTQQFICGGAVVAPTIVITAGHCTYDSLVHGIPTMANRLRVLVNSDNLVSGGQVVNVASIARHPGYNPVVGDRNDAAILHLSTSVSTTPIKVVASQSDFRYNTGTANGTVSGWGCYVNRVTNNCRTASDYPTRLRAATIPIQSQAKCSATYSAFNTAFDPASMMCAGASNVNSLAPGACFGDSGGPLTVPGLNGDYLVGLVSWGVGIALCGTLPAAFTRLASMRAWLQSESVPIQAAAFSSFAAPQFPAAAIPVSGDFDNDGFDDILSYQPGTGAEQVFRGAATAPMPSDPSVSVNAKYRPLPCDLNGDSHTDVALYGPGLRFDTALLGAVSPGSFTPTPAAAIDEDAVVVAGNFNGDQVCDLLVYQPGAGAEQLLLGNGDATFTPGTPPHSVNGVYSVFSGDFNGDGFSDVYWFSPALSAVWNGSANGTFSAGAARTINAHPTPIVGDYNGDGKDDIVLYHPGPVSDALWYSNGSGFVRTNDINIALTYATSSGDYNGDGKDDILWKQPSGASSIWLGR